MNTQDLWVYIEIVVNSDQKAQSSSNCNVCDYISKKEYVQENTL